MTHTEKALSLFRDKFHCSQSVLASFAGELGLSEEQALKIAYCFNAQMRRVCQVSRPVRHQMRRYGRACGQGAGGDH